MEKSMAYLLHIENNIECKWKQLQASWTGSVLHDAWQIRSLLRLFYTILAPILQHLQQSSGSHSLTKTTNRIWKMFALLADGNSFDESEEHIRLIMADLFFYFPSFHQSINPQERYSETLRQKGVLFLRPRGRMADNHFPIKPAFGAGRLTHGDDFMISFFLSLLLFQVPVFSLEEPPS